MQAVAECPVSSTVPARCICGGCLHGSGRGVCRAATRRRCIRRSIDAPPSLPLHPTSRPLLVRQTAPVSCRLGVCTRSSKPSSQASLAAAAAAPSSSRRPCRGHLVCRAADDRSGASKGGDLGSKFNPVYLAIFGAYTCDTRDAAWCAIAAAGTHRRRLPCSFPPRLKPNPYPHLTPTPPTPRRLRRPPRPQEPLHLRRPHRRDHPAAKLQRHVAQQPRAAVLRVGALHQLCRGGDVRAAGDVAVDVVHGHLLLPGVRVRGAPPSAFDAALLAWGLPMRCLGRGGQARIMGVCCKLAACFPACDPLGCVHHRNSVLQCK